MTNWGCVMLGMMSRAVALGLCLALLTLAHGRALAQECAGGHAPLPIAAVYVDTDGRLEAISQIAWVSGASIFYICSVDDLQRRVVAQNSAHNPSDPSKYSRFEWVVFNRQLWFCQQVRNAKSVGAAEAAAPADPRDPRAQGCGKSASSPGSLPWSQLIRILPAQ